MTVWMEVTQDDLELPVRIMDTPEELAAACGVSVLTVRSSAYRVRKGTRKHSRYHMVDIGDENERQEQPIIRRFIW